jgi:hypothetical protein
MRSSSARRSGAPAAPTETSRRGGDGKSPPPDARRIAQRLIAALGEAATCHATYQALKARQRGDRGLMDQWLWVAGVTREILRTEPAGEF